MCDVAKMMGCEMRERAGGQRSSSARFITRKWFEFAVSRFHRSPKSKEERPHQGRGQRAAASLQCA